MGSPVVAMAAVTLQTNPGPACAGTGNAHRDVAMWTGAPNSFPTVAPGNVVLLSDQLNSGGCTDGPKIAWDPTNKTAWVWWWNDNKIFLRPVAISSTGVMTPGATIDLTGDLMVTQLHATIAIKPAAGAGLPPTIWLTYPTVVGDGSLKPCNNPANWTSVPVTWWLSKSVDNGVTWSHLQIEHDPAWPYCLSATPLGGNRAIVSPLFLHTRHRYAAADFVGRLQRGDRRTVRSLEIERSAGGELRLRRSDGAYRWHLWRAHPERDTAGALVRWVGTSTDIHDHKLAEERLEARVAERTADLGASEQRFRHAFHFAGTGMAIVALDGRWTRVNRSVCEIVATAKPSCCKRRFKTSRTPMIWRLTSPTCRRCWRARGISTRWRNVIFTATAPLCGCD